MPLSPARLDDAGDLAAHRVFAQLVAVGAFQLQGILVENMIGTGAAVRCDQLRLVGKGPVVAISNLAPLIVPITIGSILKGEDVIDAMNLHAFGTGPRTWLQELHYHARDIVLIALGGVMLGGAILLGVRHQGGLWVPAWLMALAQP